MCNPFDVIPKPHREWLERVLANKERSAPPLPEGTVSVVKDTVIRTVTNTKFKTAKLFQYDERIIAVTPLFGKHYVTTASQSQVKLYCDDKLMLTVAKRSAATTILPFLSKEGKVLYAAIDSGKAVIWDGDYEGVQLTGQEYFVHNHTLYTVTENSLLENRLTMLGGRMVQTSTLLENLSTSRVIYDGCILQYLLGRYYVTLPYKNGSSKSVHLKELDGNRVIDLKTVKTTTVCVCETKGKYYQVTFVFADDFTSYVMRTEELGMYQRPCFTVTDAGLTVVLDKDGAVEVFKTIGKSAVFPDPPFDATCILATNASQIVYAEGKFLQSVSVK